MPCRWPPSNDAKAGRLSRHDISDRKCAELEALEHRQQVAHAMRVAMVGELTASLAHELNQPLTAILSNAEAAQQFLAADPPDVAEVRASLPADWSAAKVRSVAC